MSRNCESPKGTLVIDSINKEQGDNIASCCNGANRLKRLYSQPAIT